MKPFERDKVYRTRGGEQRRVVCVDGPGTQPIISVLNDGTEPAPLSHSANGRFYEGATTHSQDLIHEPETVVAWVNVYRGDSGPYIGPSTYINEAEAVAGKDRTRSYIGTRRIELTIEE